MRALLLLLLPGIAFADDNRCVDVAFTPTDNLQIVAWIETAAGDYVDTVYITQKTGTFGLGNRPGRFDFNSGPLWPYGRRITTFPVWSHHNAHAFPMVLFQSDVTPDSKPFQDPQHCFDVTGTEYATCGENQLSHRFDQSSRESRFCQPLMEHEGGWDTGTCATMAFTDKGRFSTDPNVTTGYPPRADLVKNTSDSPSVDTYKAMNPFDAVSQPTPAAGTATHAPFSAQMGPGDYVLYVETAKEMDFNASYSAQMYPSPTGISFSEYGLPYRGQPSVVYRVPFTIAASPTSALTTDYFGYGDPDGKDGTVRSPDQTITIDTPGSGGARLQLTTDGTDMYRVKVTIDPNQGGGPPPAPDMLAVTNVDASAISLQFLAPGIGADHAKVSSYEIRVRAGSPMTADNFADSMPVSATVAPNDPGKLQSVDLDGLLPQTEYWIGIRAFDDCHNAGDIAIAQVTTTERVSGSVDACFIATAAYGSLMANDVELLRHVRDTMLRTTALGELGVEAYYTFGPAFAGVIGESDLVRATARASLDPVITRVKRLAK